MGSLIHVTAWERVSLWRRVPCAFGRVMALFVVLIVLINRFGPSITIFYMIRLVAKRVPAVKITPQPLIDYSVSEATGAVLSYFGYSFEVPWNTNFKPQGTTDRSAKSRMVQLRFDSGQNLFLIAPANESGLLTELVQDQSLHMENLQPLFSDLLKRPAYDQYSALLNTTPSTVRAFGPRPLAV